MEKELHGAKLYYEANLEGLGEHTPVLYLHGWGCEHSIFSFLYSQLGLPYLTVDFPGHGHSPEPPCPWAVSDYAEQIVDLLKALHLARVFVVAHSFGGRVAIYLASHHPELVERMVITGGAGIRKSLTQEQEKKQAAYRQKQALLNKLKKAAPLSAPVEALQKVMQKKHASPDYLALSASMKETFKRIVNEDLSPYLPSCTAPTLLIWGTEDTETPLWMGQKMEKEMKDAALIPFEGRSHFAFAEEGQRFCLILENFFKGASSC